MEYVHKYLSLILYLFIPLEIFRFRYLHFSIVSISFFMESPSSISNILPIVCLSIVSTLLFIFVFSFLFSNFSHLFHTQELSFWNLFVFTGSISSSNISYMLCLFASMHVSPTISCFLQWESMISEIICSLLYRCLIDQQLDYVGSYKFYSFLLSLGILLLSSFGIGLIITFCGIIIMTRLLPFIQTISYGEVIFFLSLGFIAYLVAEGFHLSGTIAIRVSGLVLSFSMKSFFSDNAYPFVN